MRMLPTVAKPCKDSFNRSPDEITLSRQVVRNHSFSLWYFIPTQQSAFLHDLHYLHLTLCQKYVPVGTLTRNTAGIFLSPCSSFAPLFWGQNVHLNGTSKNISEDNNAVIKLRPCSSSAVLNVISQMSWKDNHPVLLWGKTKRGAGEPGARVDTGILLENKQRQLHN